ncbi:MAG: dethiobiotin synthase [Bacteroidia bacterium]
MQKIFVTGIGTDVGKTIVSAVLVEALQADYWKPIQAGDLDNSDTQKVQRLVTNTKSQFHKESFRLNTPASPHYAAELDGVEILIKNILLPQTNNQLIIEGAGGLLVPINQKGETMVDVIKHLDASVILVSRHYLGSINHTLISLNVLKSEGLKVYGIVFVGDENIATESIIKKISGVNILGRVPNLISVDKESIYKVAQLFKNVLA